MSGSLRAIEGGISVEPRPPEFTDDSLALRFAEANDGRLRYVSAWGKWMMYDGSRWAEDSTIHAFELARLECRAAAASCNNPKAATAIASAKTTAAVERLSRGDPRIAAKVEDWDADPWLLNTPGGVIDLRTGEVSPHRAQNYFTKITTVPAGGECPLWHKVLERVTGGNRDLEAYLARVFGYAATGCTKEHALFFGYGTGGNGKSLLLNTVSDILGDYAKTAPIETFTASAFERHSTDIAGLRGARLVTATETEEGRQWAESKIKTLTGGDKIAARFMRQDFFEYRPEFKLMIVGNHKPIVRSVDEAIRRRFNLIPFDVTIPQGERDPDLATKLKAEWPGILAWIVAGCLEWQRNGLCPPSAVTSATEAYLDEQDNLAAWLSERCLVETGARESASRLYASWQSWAQASGIQPGARNALLDRLRSKGFENRRSNTGSTFFGLHLKPESWLD